MLEFAFLYVPVGSEKEAKTIATELVKKKLAACVNIIPKVTSVYIWQDKLEESQEYILLAKVQSNNIKESRELIAKLHSYEVPCIAEIAISSLNEAYLNYFRS